MDGQMDTRNGDLFNLSKAISPTCFPLPAFAASPEEKNSSKNKISVKEKWKSDRGFVAVFQGLFPS